MPAVIDCFDKSAVSARRGTRKRAVNIDDTSENEIVSASCLKSCPIIPATKTNGIKIAKVVRVELIIGASKLLVAL
jgi:hypothetical protein